MLHEALSVMVVEDHGFQRRMALRLLAQLGVDAAHEAADGTAALATLAGRAQPVDVLMVDLDLPGMDGIEFIAHVAQRGLARALVVVSALEPALLHTVQTMARASGLRVLGSLEKPLTADKLAAALDRYADASAAVDEDAAVDVTPALVREGLRNEEIVPWFQPQVEFGNGRAVGVEALARWMRPDGRMIRPADFIPVIEAEGLVDTLTDRILAHGCRWLKTWAQQGLRLKLSVNVAAGTFADPRAADRLQRIVLQAGVDPAEIVLELTESSLLRNAADSLGVLARLRLKGFGLSIDDFGTGYSSLAQLSDIPFSELKIDRGFVSGVDTQSRKRAVIEASLDLARKLELATVAEGVESPEEWQLLAELGCTIAQGYLIAQAVPGEAVPDAIRRWRRPG
ncbi:MAG TPA: EAL domain-containing response regulator [Lysobacter sp.]